MIYSSKKVFTILNILYLSPFRHAAVPVTNRSHIFDLTASRLTDKNSNVRKKAMVLITDIIKNHPFCIDGGELNLGFHENKLKDVVIELQEFLQSSMKPKTDESGNAVEGSAEFDLNFEGNESISDPKVGSLLMQQRYYDDAIKFILQIHDIVPTLIQLLASTNKAEVVESMDLLVSLYVYKVEPAKDGIRRMIHLIWTRDTTNTVSATTAAVAEEDIQSLPSKKSVRDHLVYCYSSLFLNVPAKIVNADGSVSEMSQKEICNIVANRWIE